MNVESSEREKSPNKNKSPGEKNPSSHSTPSTSGRSAESLESSKNLPGKNSSSPPRPTTPVHDCSWRIKCSDLETTIKKLKEQNQALLLNHTSAIIAESENMHLRSEILKPEETVASLKSPKGHPIFLFSWISDKDNLVAHFTGLPNQETFMSLLKMFDHEELNYIKVWKVTRFSRTEELFLTMLKLKRGLSFEDLALRYGVDATTISNIFRTWLLALHEVIFKRLMKNVPSRFQNQKYLPGEFEKDFKNTRMVLDCTEIFAARPSLISRQNQLYSSYKDRITLKGLIGIPPHGSVTFVSKLYPGRTSDKEVVAHSGIMSTFVEGDVIMADKGFLIQSLLLRGVLLNIPPFSATPQFTPEEIEETYSITKARIYVERAIQRIKMYKILDFIPQNLTDYASEICQVCAALTNFRRPLIQDSFEEVDTD